MNKSGWVGAGAGVLLLIGFFRVSEAGLQQLTHCRTGDACAGSGSERTCGTSTTCWSTWYIVEDPDQGFRTDPIDGRPGVFLPRQPPDDDANAVMDCWKNVTDNARITSGFPFRDNGIDAHSGIDMASDTANYGRGAPVRSLGAGYVTYVGNTALNGYHVRVKQGDGKEATYIHLLDYQVAIGQKVNVGQKLGRMNCTGNCSYGATKGDISKTHVHIQIKNLSNGVLLDARDLYGGASCSASSTPSDPPPPRNGPPCTGPNCSIP